MIVVLATGAATMGVAGLPTNAVAGTVGTAGTVGWSLKGAWGAVTGHVPGLDSITGHELMQRADATTRRALRETKFSVLDWVKKFTEQSINDKRKTLLEVFNNLKMGEAMVDKFMAYAADPLTGARASVYMRDLILADPSFASWSKGYDGIAGAARAMARAWSPFGNAHVPLKGVDGWTDRSADDDIKVPGHVPFPVYTLGPFTVEITLSITYSREDSTTYTYAVHMTNERTKAGTKASPVRLLVSKLRKLSTRQVGFITDALLNGLGLTPAPPYGAIAARRPLTSMCESRVGMYPTELAELAGQARAHGIAPKALCVNRTFTTCSPWHSHARSSPS